MACPSFCRRPFLSCPSRPILRTPPSSPRAWTPFCCFTLGSATPIWRLRRSANYLFLFFFSSVCLCLHFISCYSSSLEENWGKEVKGQVFGFMLFLLFRYGAEKGRTRSQLLLFCSSHVNFMWSKLQFRKINKFVVWILNF